MLNQRGSLTIEAFVALFVYMIITSLLLAMLKSLHRWRSTDWYYFDIACMQLQELIAICEITEISSNELALLCNREEFEIREHNNRLVKSPGYQIMLTDVQDIEFSLDDETIWMRGQFQNEKFELAIAKREWWR